MKRSPSAVARFDFYFGLIAFAGRLIGLGLRVAGLAVLVFAAGLLPTRAAFPGLRVAFGLVLSGIFLLVSLVFAELLPRMLEPVHEEVLQQDLDLVLVLFVDGRLALDVMDQQVVGVVEDRKVLRRENELK